MDCCTFFYQKTKIKNVTMLPLHQFPSGSTPTRTETPGINRLLAVFLTTIAFATNDVTIASLVFTWRKVCLSSIITHFPYTIVIVCGLDCILTILKCSCTSSCNRERFLYIVNFGQYFWGRFLSTFDVYFNLGSSCISSLHTVYKLNRLLSFKKLKHLTISIDNMENLIFYG